MTPDSPERAELVEKLAAIEHERWSDWHRYASENWNVAMVSRWNEQARTPYAELSGSEKESDREQVRRYWPLIESALLKAKAEGIKEGARLNPDVKATLCYEAGLEEGRAALQKAREEEREKAILECAEIARQSEDGECRVGCDSYAHEELCPVVNPRRVILALSKKDAKECAKCRDGKHGECGSDPEVCDCFEIHRKGRHHYFERREHGRKRG